MGLKAHCVPRILLISRGGHILILIISGIRNKKHRVCVSSIVRTDNCIPLYVHLTVEFFDRSAFIAAVHQDLPQPFLIVSRSSAFESANAQPQSFCQPRHCASYFDNRILSFQCKISDHASTVFRIDVIIISPIELFKQRAK